MGVLETFKTSLTLACVFLFCVCSANAAKPGPAIISAVPAGSCTAGSSGILILTSDVHSKIRFLGYGFTNSTDILFTHDSEECTGGKTTESFSVMSIDENNGIVEVKFQFQEIGHDTLYVCMRTAKDWEHQGKVPWISAKVVLAKTSLLPLWIQISICSVLLVFSGLFSGLNLGLMSLDQTELTIIQKVGSEKEKQYARRIFPLRKRGNLLLCTLLLGNVMVNSTFTILFDNLTNGLIAVISSTIGIVMFGEIIPQAICSRHGLAVGAKTYWITRFFMVVTFPCSFPISLILDKVLGEEMGQIFNKEKLQELIRMTADQQVLHNDEANIMSGALQLNSISVEDVMTKIEDVYMLELNTELNFETLAEIMRHGYTRVPVYEKEITNIVNLLNTKDLALIDPDDKTHLGTVCRFYDHKPLYVDYDLRLNVMLQEFLKANCHMAIVQKLHNTENKDPYFENIGVVTLEDVIEEILQSEIIDETDRMVDNRQKKPVTGRHSNYSYSLYPRESIVSTLPKQLEFVAFQFLLSNIEAFSEKNLNRNVLKNLMKKNIVFDLTPTTPVSDQNYIFMKGQACDKFVLILQGTVEVTIGNENLSFESGPFSHFGVESINAMRHASNLDLKRLKDYVPDFSVRAMTPVQYLAIKKYHYMAAIRTTRMLRSQKIVDDNNADSQLNVELAKLKDKNDSNSRIVDIYSPANLPLEALKHDDSPKKRSTSSLDRVLSLTRKQDSLTRRKRSGSDTKERTLDSSPDYDARDRRKNLSESSNTDHYDAASVSDKEETDSKVESPPNLASQTSHPFTPTNRSEDNLSGISPESSQKACSESPNVSHTDSKSDGDGISSSGGGDVNFPQGRTSAGEFGDNENVKSGMEMSSSGNDDTLEKVPLVEIKRSPQNAGNDNPGMSAKFEMYNDELEAVPLMQQPSQKSEGYPKDNNTAPS